MRPVEHTHAPAPVLSILGRLAYLTLLVYLCVGIPPLWAGKIKTEPPTSTHTTGRFKTSPIPVAHLGSSNALVLAAITMEASPEPQGSAPIGLPSGTVHQTSLSWTASTTTGIVYDVFRSTTAGGEAGTTAITGAAGLTGTSFTDTAVVSGTKYFYVVDARSTTTGNQSGFSNEASATIPTNPNNPTGCNASAN